MGRSGYFRGMSGEVRPLIDREEAPRPERDSKGMAETQGGGFESYKASATRGVPAECGELPPLRRIEGNFIGFPKTRALRGTP